MLEYVHANPVVCQSEIVSRVSFLALILRELNLFSGISFHLVIVFNMVIKYVIVV